MWICVCDCIVPCGLPSQNRCIPRVGSGSTTKMNEWIIFSKLWDLPIWLGLVHTEINIYVQYLLDFLEFYWIYWNLPIYLWSECTGICQYIYVQYVLEFFNDYDQYVLEFSDMSMFSIYWNSPICLWSVCIGSHQYVYVQCVLEFISNATLSKYWNLPVRQCPVCTVV